MEAFNSLSHRDSCFHHFTERIIKQVRLLNMNDHVDLLVSLVKKEKKNLHEPTWLKQKGNNLKTTGIA